MSFYRHRNALGRCGNGSGETTVVVEGWNQVAGLWGRPPSGHWPPEPTSMQDSLHWLLMSVGVASYHRGFLGVRRCCGGLRMSWWMVWRQAYHYLSSCRASPLFGWHHTAWWQRHMCVWTTCPESWEWCAVFAVRFVETCFRHSGLMHTAQLQ